MILFNSLHLIIKMRVLKVLRVLFLFLFLYDCTFISLYFCIIVPLHYITGSYSCNVVSNKSCLGSECNFDICCLNPSLSLYFFTSFRNKWKLNSISLFYFAVLANINAKNMFAVLSLLYCSLLVRVICIEFM